MIELISIHIPKTGGTSFYDTLRQVYGKQLSISYKRRDYIAATQGGQAFEETLDSDVRVLHGHLYYRELAQLHQRDQPKIICWLRDPVQRVISNYRFFIRGLQNPERNPAAYELNKHRINESLIEYASLDENRNRMADFLDGIALKDLFFIGLLDQFEQDIERLGKMLNWKTSIQVPRLNALQIVKRDQHLPTNETIRAIQQLNAKDCELYAQACNLR